MGGNEKVLPVLGARWIGARFREDCNAEFEWPRHWRTTRTLTHAIQDLFDVRQTARDRLHHWRWERFVGIVVGGCVDLNGGNVQDFLDDGRCWFLGLVFD